MDPEIKELCAFLRQVLNEALSAEKAEARIETVSALRRTELQGVYENLFHFISDGDIRAKDAGYRDLQESEMKKLIMRLETGEFARANSVTFLRKT